MAEHDRFELDLAAALRAYATDAPTQVRPTELARQFATAYPHGRPVIARWRLGLGPTRALAVLVLLALMLVALIATALFVGLQRPVLLRNVSLAPTGVQVLTSDPGAYTRMVQDGTGMLWAREDGGRLVRFDPATGTARTWTLGDDAAFGSTDIAPAKGGGVWLVNGRTLRLFDGTVFREVIEAPAEIAILTEAPDATLWAGTTDGMVLRWNGSSWTSLDPRASHPNASISAIAVDAAGHPWIGWGADVASSGAGGVSRYDGSTWTTFNANDLAPLGNAVWSIAPLPDGTVWVATEGGIVRFDGSSWTNETSDPSFYSRTISVEAAADGAVWAAAGDTNSAAITVKQFDGHRWVWWGPPDGLPVVAGAAWVEPTKDGVYLGTDVGIYRLANGRWLRLWPLDASATNLTPLIAISHDELWASNENGLWHFVNGAWTNEPIDPDRPTDAPAAMALAPDGTLWAAGVTGVAYRRDGRWTIADAGAANAVAVDTRGTVWVAGTGGISGIPVWTLRFDGTTWARGTIQVCPIEPGAQPSLAVDSAGALWMGVPSSYWAGGLARFDGRSWQAFSELGGSLIDGAVVLGTAPGGDVWVTLEYAFVPTLAEPSQTGPTQARLAYFDGNGWTFVDLPTDYQGSAWMPDPLLIPDGTVWASTGRGLAHYDGRQWTFPFASSLVPSGFEVGPAARDGTIFGRIGWSTGSAIGWQSLVRFPSRATQP